MSIQFHCQCGKPLRSKEELAGKRTKCPHCGAVMMIPAPEAVGVAIALESGPEAGSPATVFDLPALNVVSEPGTPEPSLGANGQRRYKVLTQREMGFAVKFDAVKFEETLNSFAGQGWGVKAALTITMPSHAGPHDEIVVILERA